MRAQQSAFNYNQESYNEKRPYEALAMKTPAEVYKLPPRLLPAEPRDHAYLDGFEQRRVRCNGAINRAGVQMLVGEAITVETVGIEPIEDGLWQLHLGPLRLGVVPPQIAVRSSPEGGCHPCARTQVSPMVPVAQG